jgi:hypothetical protein
MLAFDDGEDGYVDLESHLAAALARDEDARELD